MMTAVLDFNPFAGLLSKAVFERRHAELDAQIAARRAVLMTHLGKSGAARASSAGVKEEGGGVQQQPREEEEEDAGMTEEDMLLLLQNHDDAELKSLGLSKSECVSCLDLLANIEKAVPVSGREGMEDRENGDVVYCCC